MATSDDVFTLREMRIIHEGFKGQCNDMNEARLTTALGDALSMLTELEEVMGWVFAGLGSGGWTYAMHEPACVWQTAPSNVCDCRVQRARALWAKLQIEESDQIQEKSNA